MNLIKKTILSLITLAVLLVPASPVLAASEQGLAHGKGNGLTKSETQEQTLPQEQTSPTVTNEEMPTQSAVTSSAKSGTSTQTHSMTPAGNNGTLKIHEAGTPAGTENNDPKVCSFNVEGFGFDANQTGYLQFTVQGGDKPTGTDAGPYAFGPTSAKGFYASQYFSLKDGHYKATLYGKMLPNGQLTDVKAKSKVFKVSCTNPVTSNNPETPTNPTTPDQNGEVLSAATTSDPTPMLANTGQSTLAATLTAINFILAAGLLAIRSNKSAVTKTS